MGFRSEEREKEREGRERGKLWEIWRAESLKLVKAISLLKSLVKVALLVILCSELLYLICLFSPYIIH